MRPIFAAVCAAVASAAAEHPVNPTIVSDIKNKTTKWVPMEASENPIGELSFGELHGLLGTVVRPPLGTLQPEGMNTLLPEAFDSREQWPGCVHPIRDQQQCGSCWAFAASEAFSDRACIASKGAVNVIFSPENLVQCESDNMGCNGGYLDRAWKYLESSGIVSDECQKYTSGAGKTEACKSTCDDPSVEYKVFKCEHGSLVEAVNPQQVKEQIYAHGPMETGFDVFEDFMSYKSGVYHHVSGKLLGGHAVKILGWGKADDGTEYWLCANSWNIGWGEGGFFRIQAGECSIDASVWACVPETTTRERLELY